MTSIMLDVIIASLLFITVIYCVRLSRKINLIHQSREELNRFIGEFNHAITRAEDNIAQLKYLGDEADERLQEHIKKARYMANDLSILMDKGEKISAFLGRNMAASGTISPYSSDNTARSYGGRKNVRSPGDKESIYRAGTPVNKKAATGPILPDIESDGDSSDMSYDKKANKGEYVQMPPMTAAKRRVLDDVLEQIAVRKQANVSRRNRESAKKDISGKNTTGKDAAAKDNMFDKKRLAETLKVAQHAE